MWGKFRMVRSLTVTSQNVPASYCVNSTKEYSLLHDRLFTFVNIWFGISQGFYSLKVNCFELVAIS